VSLKSASYSPINYVNAADYTPNLFKSSCGNTVVFTHPPFTGYFFPPTFFTP
jgi:hypothetical protein